MITSMSMRTRLAAALALIAFSGWLGMQVRYPASWYEIHLGMTRAEVSERVGPPTFDAKDIKGAFWERNGPIETTELWVYFDHDVATMVAIERRTGSSEHFYRQVFRSESSH